MGRSGPTARISFKTVCVILKEARRTDVYAASPAMLRFPQNVSDAVCRFEDLLLSLGMNHAVTAPSNLQRRWLVWSLRVAVLLVIAWFVRGTVERGLEELSQHEWHVRPAWLIGAGVLYFLGLVPMAWFWSRTLAALSQSVPWSATLRAYFLGHLGKYVPGKAMAVILRIAAVRRWAPTMRIAILSIMLETLTMMAVGAFLAAALSAFLLRDLGDDSPLRSRDRSRLHHFLAH
jgi:hypothetical protein